MSPIHWGTKIMYIKNNSNGTSQILYWRNLLGADLVQIIRWDHTKMLDFLGGSIQNYIPNLGWTILNRMPCLFGTIPNSHLAKCLEKSQIIWQVLTTILSPFRTQTDNPADLYNLAILTLWNLYINTIFTMTFV